VSYEGQAPAELEALATLAPGVPPYPFTIGEDAVDLRPVIRAIARDLRAERPRAEIARGFHETLADAIGQVCRLMRERSHLERVALSGGCFQNRLLHERARATLEQAGFSVLAHERVPCNDGGIALGQAAIAAHRLERSHVPRHSG
jgi:hydrogenase maturation protein HypF